MWYKKCQSEYLNEWFGLETGFYSACHKMKGH